MIRPASRTWLAAAAFAAAAVTSLAAPVAAQSAPSAQRGMDAQVFWFLQNMPPESARPLGALINAVLADTVGHMRMADRRAANAADSARAAGIVRTMRAALAPYADVGAAERDGYALFLPWLVDQSIYHYNHMGNIGLAATTFDAARPSSLLYRKDVAGRKVLVGAMFTAPATATPAELDARLPTSIAYWHQHVNFCAMSPAQAMQGVQDNDAASFARWLQIESREACAAAGGFFIPQLFGWMAHVNAFDGEAPGAIWGSEGKDHMHRHSH